MNFSCYCRERRAAAKGRLWRIHTGGNENLQTGYHFQYIYAIMGKIGLILPFGN
jgi:hypothetical protein